MFLWKRNYDVRYRQAVGLLARYAFLTSLTIVTAAAFMDSVLGVQSASEWMVTESGVLGNEVSKRCRTIL